MCANESDSRDAKRSSRDKKCDSRDNVTRVTQNVTRVTQNVTRVKLCRRKVVTSMVIVRQINQFTAKLNAFKTADYIVMKLHQTKMKAKYEMVRPAEK